MKSEILARIEENRSMLEMAKLHMDSRACLVLQERILALEKQLTTPSSSIQLLKDLRRRYPNNLEFGEAFDSQIERIENANRQEIIDAFDRKNTFGAEMNGEQFYFLKYYNSLKP